MMRGIRTTPVQVVGFIWPLGAELHQKLAMIMIEYNSAGCSKAEQIC